jgi:2-hydroxycyclohexanecarboxyl-CoA dehydrogenase
VTQPPRFWDTGPEDWTPWLSVNFYGVLNCSRAVLPGMVERGWGRIVTMISDAGRVGEPNLVVYSGAKAGGRLFAGPGQGGGTPQRDGGTVWRSPQSALPG